MAISNRYRPSRAQAQAAWLIIKKDGDAAKKAKGQRRRSGENSPGGGKNEKRVASPRSIDSRSPGKKKEKFAGVVPSNLVNEFSAA